jgi:dTDP-4-amino-4,6-dideoxygalactose transaminase
MSTTPEARPEPVERLFLSPPHITQAEIDATVSALRSGWVAPLGPEVDGFEQDIIDFTDVSHAVALSSGTAALHLGLMALGVTAGDDVIVPTLTFGATAFAVTYTGARPLFMDVDEATWNLDPGLLEQTLSERSKHGRLPAAIIPVDLFGRPCDYQRILPIAAAFDIPVLEDAAEALGSRIDGRSTGSFGRAGVFSFNGNKIMTTGGGGMLVSSDAALVSKVRFWSTQSREPQPWYEHAEIGYNYRMSNVLAAIGRAQLARLPGMIERRLEIRSRYADQLGQIPGVQVVLDPVGSRGNAWLTNVRFDPSAHPGAPEQARLALEAQNIESRPVWKPMHLQPVFADAPAVVNGTSERIFSDGLCLPSGSAMSDGQVDVVCEVIAGVLRAS